MKSIIRLHDVKAVDRVEEPRSRRILAHPYLIEAPGVVANTLLELILSRLSAAFLAEGALWSTQRWVIWLKWIGGWRY